MTPADAQVDEENSRVLLSLPSGERVVLNYDASQMVAQVRKKVLTDKQMIGSWGQLNQVVFSSHKSLKDARWQFEFLRQR